jgi:hypothetical protein
MTMRNRFLGSLFALGALASSTACDSFFQVDNPNIIDGTKVDPVLAAEEFSRSVWQNFAFAYGGVIVYSAWFTNEARVGDTFPTRNEYGRRLIDDRNGTHNDEVWWPLARAVASAEDALTRLAEIPNADQSVRIARVALAGGFADLLMGESFCQGVVDPLGSPLAPAQTLDRAIERLKQARQIADKSYAAKMDTVDAKAISAAARVGMARAYLQKGDKANAIAMATGIPADFVFNVTYVDDAANRGRLGNNVWNFSFSRISLVVGPEWRAKADSGDTRIKYQDMKRLAQDGTLQFYRQNKFDGFAAPIRLASGLEARYIVAEASGDRNQQLTLINERRGAGGQTALVGAGLSDAQVLTELMEQRGRDFWLEGKRLGDWRRNSGNVNHILQPGSTYYKADLGTVSDHTCFPIPAAEKDNNPNFKK